MELGDKSLNLVVLVIAETGGLISRIQSIPEPGKIAGRFRSTLGWIVPWNRILWYYYYDNEVMMMMQYYYAKMILDERLHD